MSHVSLSDVQTTNLFQLQNICLGLAKDPLATCRRYDLTQAQADHLLQLNADQLWSIVVSVGAQTLFSPRRDLIKLLQVPRSLTGVMTAAHSPPAPP